MAVVEGNESNENLSDQCTSDDDTVYAGGGDDTIAADDGDDVVYGDGAGDSNDGGVAISENPGSDSISGEDGDDTLYGDGGDDVIDGGDDDDSISGGTGADSMSGGADDDIFVFTQSDDDAAVDTVDGGEDEDTVNFQGTYDASDIVFSNVEVLCLGDGSEGAEVTLTHEQAVIWTEIEALGDDGSTLNITYSTDAELSALKDFIYNSVTLTGEIFIWYKDLTESSAGGSSSSGSSSSGSSGGGSSDSSDDVAEDASTSISSVLETNNNRLYKLYHNDEIVTKDELVEAYYNDVQNFSEISCDPVYIDDDGTFYSYDGSPMYLLGDSSILLTEDSIAELGYELSDSGLFYINQETGALLIDADGEIVLGPEAKGMDYDDYSKALMSEHETSFILDPVLESFYESWMQSIQETLSGGLVGDMWTEENIADYFTVAEVDFEVDADAAGAESVSVIDLVTDTVNMIAGSM